MSSEGMQVSDAAPSYYSAGADEQCVPTGYKQTEVGVLPQDWDVVPLRAMCRQIVDGTHFTPRYVADGVPFYSVENVSADDFENVKFISRSEHELLTQRCKPERNDILLTRIGSLGDTKLIDWDVDASIYVSLALLKVREVIDARYLYCYTQGRQFVLDVENRSLLNAAPKKINMGDIGAVPVVVPRSRKEQRAIAEALSDVDGSLGALEALIAKKRAIKQAAMQQLLTGKTRLPGFGGEWENRQVRDVITGYFCGPSPTCEERNISGEEEWGVLKTTAATVGNGWAWRQHKALPRAYWGREHQKVRVGDVIITKAGPRHRVGVSAWVDYVPDRLIVSGKMIGLRPNPQKAVPLILAAALGSKHTQRFLDERTTGMAESQVNFENQDVLEAPLRLPPVDEQRAIATVLSDMDAEITALEARRDKTRAIKAGMMQQLLTGRVRLVKPEPAA